MVSRPHDHRHHRPLRPGRAQDRHRPALVGLPAACPRWWGRSRRARCSSSPASTPPTRRWRWAWSTRWCRARGARRRGRPLVRADPAPLAPGPAPGQDRDERRAPTRSTPRPTTGMELMALNHVYGPEPQEGIRSFQEKPPGRLAPLPRRPGARARGGRRWPSPEWTDWYAREDPTRWVLPEILRRRGRRAPRPRVPAFGDGPWLSYGEVNARANRIANGLIARGVAPGRVGQRAAAQLRGVRAGLVRDPEGRGAS